MECIKSGTRRTPLLHIETEGDDLFDELLLCFGFVPNKHMPVVPTKSTGRHMSGEITV